VCRQHQVSTVHLPWLARTALSQPYMDATPAWPYVRLLPPPRTPVVSRRPKTVRKVSGAVTGVAAAAVQSHRGRPVKYLGRAGVAALSADTMPVGQRGSVFRRSAHSGRSGPNAITDRRHARRRRGRLYCQKDSSWFWAAEAEGAATGVGGNRAHRPRA